MPKAVIHPLPRLTRTCFKCGVEHPYQLVREANTFEATGRRVYVCIDSAACYRRQQSWRMKMGRIVAWFLNKFWFW